MATRKADARSGRLAAVIAGLLPRSPPPRPPSLTRYRSGTAAPSRWRRPRPPVQVISTGGIAGWQVALIAAGAALAAAAVFVDRKLAGRHHRLIRMPATAHHACLTTGPPGPEPSGRPALWPQPGPAARPGNDLRWSRRCVSAEHFRIRPVGRIGRPQLIQGRALVTSMMRGIPHAGRREGPRERVRLRRGRAAVRRTGSSGRDIPRNQASLRTHGFGDLKLFGPKTMCPLIAVRDRKER
jgi:hypothetical protein